MERPGQVLAELPLRERLVAVALRIGVRVLQDRAGREGVDDADGLALAGQAAARDAVGAAELLRRVPADGVVTHLALELRQWRRAVGLDGRRDRAVALRARPRIAEPCRGRPDLRPHEDGSRAEAGHAEHRSGHGGRDAGVGRRRAHERAPMAVDVELCAECALGGGDAAARADVAMRGLDGRDAQAGRSQPGADRRDGCRSRLEPGPVLGRLQVVPVRCAAGRRRGAHRRPKRGDAAPRSEVDADVHMAGRLRRPHRRMSGPGGRASLQDDRVRAGARRRHNPRRRNHRGEAARGHGPAHQHSCTHTITPTTETLTPDPRAASKTRGRDDLISSCGA